MLEFVLAFSIALLLVYIGLRPLEKALEKDREFLDIIRETPSSSTPISSIGVDNPRGPTESYKTKKIPLISPDYKSITVEQLWDLMHDDPVVDAIIKTKGRPIKSGIRTIKGKRTLVWSPEPTTSTGPSSPSKPLSSPSKPRRRVKPRAKVRAGKARPRHVP